MRAAHLVRAVTPDEEQALQRIAKATSERGDGVKRMRALLGVRAGQAYTHAAREAGYWCAAPSPVSIPSAPSNSSSGLSKPWPAGIVTQPRSSGMVPAGAGAAIRHGYSIAT